MAKKKTAKKSTPKAAKKATKAASSRKAAPKKATTKAAKKSPSKPAPKAAKKTVKKAAKKAAKRVASKKVTSSAKKSSKASKSAAPKRVRKIKVKSPLSKRELAKFRELLIEKRRSLIGDLVGMEGSALGRGLQDSAGDLSNMPTHPADVGSDNFEHEFTLGLMESERQLLAEIEQALERIDNGTYGVCVGTGEPIGIPRLTARPWCKYCIEYQRLIEKGLVRPSEDDEYGEDEDDEDLFDDEEEDDDVDDSSDDDDDSDDRDEDDDD